MTTASVSLQGPAPRDLAEVATTSPWCQRWSHRTHVATRQSRLGVTPTAAAD